MSALIKTENFRFRFKIYKNRWLLNFVPRFYSVCICDDDTYEIIHRWHNFTWMFLSFDLLIKSNVVQLVYSFPDDKITDKIIDFNDWLNSKLTWKKSK